MRHDNCVKKKQDNYFHNIVPEGLFCLSHTGMNALQLQNLATLAAAAAAAQTSATTTNANPLSTTTSALGALTSPGEKYTLSVTWNILPGCS